MGNRPVQRLSCAHLLTWPSAFLQGPALGSKAVHSHGGLALQWDSCLAMQVLRVGGLLSNRMREHARDQPMHWHSAMARSFIPRH